MGVPAFFRWLSKRYPKIAIDALSEDELEYFYDEYQDQGKKGNDTADPNEINLDGNDESEATSKDLVKFEMQRRIKENNPSFDNLYLDMNGIIHPCTHPPGRPEPTTEAEMFNNIFEYLDKIMRIVKPQRLVYMAVDGVAPRAKMNQQRARRFKGALDIEEQEAREQELFSKWSKEGVKFTDAALGKKDSSKPIYESFITICRVR